SSSTVRLRERCREALQKRKMKKMQKSSATMRKSERNTSCSSILAAMIWGEFPNTEPFVSKISCSSNVTRTSCIWFRPCAVTCETVWIVGTRSWRVFPPGPFQEPQRSAQWKSSTSSSRRSEASTRAPLCTPTSATISIHRLDRKSTRLNSSHDQISYAVFCLKKKKKIKKKI